MKKPLIIFIIIVVGLIAKSGLYVVSEGEQAITKVYLSEGDA